MLSLTMTRPAEPTDADLRAMAKRIKADLDQRRGKKKPLAQSDLEKDEQPEDDE